MKTGIPQENDPSHTSSSIPDHVEKMTNMGVKPGSSSTPMEVEEPRRSKRAKVVSDKLWILLSLDIGKAL